MQNSEPSAALLQRYHRFFVGVVLAVFAIMGVNSLTGGLEAFQDKLLGHAQLVEAFTWLRLTLGDQSFPQVVVGKEGWLYFVPGLSDYQNFSALSEADFATLQNQLDRLSAEAAARGTVLVLVVAPNKESVYPEYVPSQLRRLNAPPQMDQFVTFMRQHSTVPVIDLQAALLQAKVSTPNVLYYRTDTHWNAFGAYIAYQTLLKALPGNLQPAPLELFPAQSNALKARDLAVLLGADFIQEPNVGVDFPGGVTLKVTTPSDATQPIVSFTTNPDAQAASLVMYHDSFGDALQPYLSQNFKQAVFVTGADRLDPYWMQANPPQVVIVEVVERNLERLLITLNPP